MKQEDPLYPMFVYIYELDGTYGNPVQICSKEQLRGLGTKIMIQIAMRKKREIRITDPGDSLLFHAKKRQDSVGRQVNDGGKRYRWVGIGWIDEGYANNDETRVVDLSVGIIGSRRRNSYSDYGKTEKALLSLPTKDPLLLSRIRIVSGGCKVGGDKFAEDLAEEEKIPILIHYPDRSKLDPELMKKNPRAAYAKIAYARNELIARDSNILIAVVAPDRKGGTENTIKHFKKKFGKTEKKLIKEGKLILV